MFILFLIIGYACSDFFNRYIFPNVIPFLTKISKYISAQNNLLNSSVVKDFILFFFSEGIRTILAFIICIFLSMATFFRKAPLLGYIFGMIIISFTINIQSLFFYFLNTEKPPFLIMKPVFIGLLNDIIFIPFFCWLGFIIGSKLIERTRVTH